MTELEKLQKAESLISMVLFDIKKVEYAIEEWPDAEPNKDLHLWRNFLKVSLRKICPFPLSIGIPIQYENYTLLKSAGWQLIYIYHDEDIRAKEPDYEKSQIKRLKDFQELISKQIAKIKKELSKK